MKTKILNIILLVFTHIATAQLFGPGALVCENCSNIGSVNAADIDGDGDMDILSSASDALRWFENLDGMGNFGNETVLLVSPGQSFSIFPSDLDGDGDIDVVATQFDNDLLVWFENLDGNGNFSSQKIITTVTFGPFYTTTSDLDGDGDNDVILNSDQDNVLSWFENTDGEGAFGPRQVITDSATNGRSTAVGDIDGDDDLDVVSSSSGDITVAWFENLDGEGTFGPEHIVAGTALAVITIALADIDGDGDLDIATGTPAEDKISWFENLDGAGNFGTEQIIITDADFVRVVQGVDVDTDGDVDLIAVASSGNELLWVENTDGLGTFSAKQFIGTLDNPRTIFAADLDGDGDPDVLSGTRKFSAIDDVVWFPNLSELSILDFLKKNIEVYPNPTKESLFISAKNIDIKQICVYDLKGKLVLKRNTTTELSLQVLSQGLFIIRIETDKGSVVKKVLKQ